MSARVVLPVRGVHVHCINGAPSPTLAGATARTILSLALGQLRRYLGVARGFPL